LRASLLLFPGIRKRSLGKFFERTYLETREIKTWEKKKKKTQSGGKKEPYYLSGGNAGKSIGKKEKAKKKRYPG